MQSSLIILHSVTLKHITGTLSNYKMNDICNTNIANIITTTYYRYNNAATDDICCIQRQLPCRIEYILCYNLGHNCVDK